MSLLYDKTLYDCIGFYRPLTNAKQEVWKWRLQKLTKEDTKTRNTMQMKKTNTSNYFLAPHRMFIWRLLQKSSNVEFNVMVSHLSSGESPEAAVKRTQDFSKIMAFINGRPGARGRTVILQDSNFSNLYQADELNVKFVQDYFIDGVGEGNEFFAMRGTVGDQKAKHCKLMFDKIDRILIPKSEGRCTPFPNNFGFAKYNLKHFDEISTARKNRQDLEQKCRNEKWQLVKKGDGKPRYLHELYPNAGAPSDHPPVAADIIFNHEEIEMSNLEEVLEEEKSNFKYS